MQDNDIAKQLANKRRGKSVCNVISAYARCNHSFCDADHPQLNVFSTARHFAVMWEEANAAGPEAVAAFLEMAKKGKSSNSVL